MSRPKVSVIIPVYNRETTIVRAIESVRRQSFSDWELIVVDDCSIDRTCEVVSNIDDPRIRLLRQSQNGGPSVARQRGIEIATGENVALLDSDDEWLPNKLSAQLGSGAPVVSCSYLISHREREWAFLHPAVVDWVEHLHFKCMLRAGSTLLARRTLVEEVGGFDPQLRYYEDWDLALRLAAEESINVLPEPLVRIHVGDTRSMVAAEPSIRHFLEKHDGAFRCIGASHRRRVRGQHFQNLAAGAFGERLFTLGSKWLLESYAANPAQNPARLAALALAPVDAFFGTSLIQRAAAASRGAAAHGNAEPAP